MPSENNAPSVEHDPDDYLYREKERGPANLPTVSSVPPLVSRPEKVTEADVLSRLKGLQNRDWTVSGTEDKLTGKCVMPTGKELVVSFKTNWDANPDNENECGNNVTVEYGGEVVFTKFGCLLVWPLPSVRDFLKAKLTEAKVTARQEFMRDLSPS